MSGQSTNPNAQGYPSTVWQQLAVPSSPAYAVPYISSDQITPVIDSVNFSYTDASATLVGSLLPGQLTLTNGIRVSYIDATSSPGNTIINRVAGKIVLPAGQQVITITNSCVFANSLVFFQSLSLDNTATRFALTQSSGQFTLTANATATSNVYLLFKVDNVF